MPHAGVTVTSYREPLSVIPILTFVLHFEVIKRLPHVASAGFQMYSDLLQGGVAFYRSGTGALGRPG
jgi:hypothetical protein